MLSRASTIFLYVKVRQASEVRPTIKKGKILWRTSNISFLLLLFLVEELFIILIEEPKYTICVVNLCAQASKLWHS